MNIFRDYFPHSVKLLGTICIIMLMMLAALQHWAVFVFAVFAMLFLAINFFYCSSRITILTRRNQIRRSFLEQVKITAAGPEDNPPSYEDILQTEAPPPPFNSLSFVTSSPSVNIAQPDTSYVSLSSVTPELLSKAVGPLHNYWTEHHILPHTSQHEMRQHETHQYETQQHETHHHETHHNETHHLETHQHKTHHHETNQHETHQHRTHQHETHQHETLQHETNQHETHQLETNQHETHQLETNQHARHHHETHHKDIHQHEVILDPSYLNNLIEESEQQRQTLDTCINGNGDTFTHPERHSPT